MEQDLAKVKNLPDGGYNITDPAQGKWQRLSDLTKVADYIGVSKTDTIKLRNIKSVPHTWGHVVAFQAALEDKHHPGHGDARGQWRALLAMLALRGRNSPLASSLSVEKIDLGEEDEKLTAKFHHFLKVVGDERDVDGEVHLLYAHSESSSSRKVLVGILSPSTVVVPARDFGGDKNLPHKWAHRGLGDPLNYFDDGEVKLTPDQGEVCRQFVTKLIAGLKELPSKTREEIWGEADKEEEDGYTRINKQLTAFEKELAGLAESIEHWKLEERDGLVETDFWAKGTNSGASKVYLALQSVSEVDREDGDPVRTDLKIGDIEVGTESFKVVLADPSCAAKLGKAPESIAVIGGMTTLADLPSDLPDKEFKTYCVEAAKHNILLVRPEDLLSGHLTSLKNFEIGRAAEPPARTVHPRGFETTLLPVKPMAMMVFETIEKLVESLSMGGTRMEPQVYLKLKVVSERYERTDSRGDGSRKRKRDKEGVLVLKNEKSTDHEITRKYEEDDQALVSPPSSLAAWPDFRYEEWKWNYLYGNCAYPEGHPRVVATTGLSKAYLMEDMRPRKIGDWRERLDIWASAEGPLTSKGTTDETAWLRIGDELLIQAKWPFDAVLFRLEDERGSAYAGIGILPGAKEVKAIKGSSAQIACDFGTTNTIVYTNVKEIEAARIESRLRRFNNLKKKHRFVDDDDGYAFMPVNTVNIPNPFRR